MSSHLSEKYILIIIYLIIHTNHFLLTWLVLYPLRFLPVWHKFPKDEHFLTHLHWRIEDRNRSRYNDNCKCFSWKNKYINHMQLQDVCPFNLIQLCFFTWALFCKLQYYFQLNMIRWLKLTPVCSTKTVHLLNEQSVYT